MADYKNLHSKWIRDGLESGWISLYEHELLAYLGREYGDLNPSVETAVVFASLFLQAGHVYLPLDQPSEQWIRQLDIDPEHSELVGLPEINLDDIIEFSPVGTTPGKENCLFMLDETRFYIRRYWYYEYFVAQKLTYLSSNPMECTSVQSASEVLDQLFPGKREGDENTDYQKVAAALSLIKRFLLISGGPGTGKTTTVARILALVLQVSDKPLRIALAAPTGKAATRMAEALQEELKELHLESRLLELIPDKAQTLHRLLAPVEKRGLLPPAVPSHLPYDLIVMDEASMVDLTLMYRLMNHMDKNTRLIMMGDKDQLASVEAGSVLADICRKQDNRFTSITISYLKNMGMSEPLSAGEQDALNDSIVYLTKNYRFDPDSGLSLLAEAANRSAIDTINNLLHSSEYPNLEIQSFQYTSKGLHALFTEMSRLLKRCRGRSAEQMIRLWSESVWLSVLRRGPFGADALNYMIEESLIRNQLIHPRNGWYSGRPVLVTRNDYTLGIYNGDMGVCTLSDKEVPWITFIKEDGNLKQIPASRLQIFEPGYVLTVHKSQGSEFGKVTLLLPREDTPVLTRELFYTAVTRAKNSFRLLGNSEVLHRGLARKTVRYTGLEKALYTKV